MKYNNYNDYELIYMVRENDGFSKSILYDKYYPLLKNISREFYNQYKYYGYEYDDFLQEAIFCFEKALINYNENQDTKFYSFVLLCVKRGLITFSKRISNYNKHKPSIYYVDIDKCNITDANSNIDNIMTEQNVYRMIKKAILELPLNDSSILELRYNGFSYKEISILMEIPSTTIEYKLRKMRKVISSYCCKEAI